jgi:hypothetical protein
MKKKIALLLATTMVAALLLSMGAASAVASKTIYFDYYENYYPYPAITDYTLTPSTTITEGQVFSYSQINSYGFNIMGVKPGSPTSIAYWDGNSRLSILVTRKSSAATPYPTYYYGSGIVGYTGANQYIYLANGDYVYASLEVANPLPNIPVGTICPLSSGHLGGLLPSNTHLTFSSSNPAIASTTGAIIYGNNPGTAKLYVYYDNSLIIVKDITVGGSGALPGSIVTADDNLKIGPTTFLAVKGKSYKFSNCRLDGAVVSPTSLRWESSNTSIATVSKSGVVRTRKAGSVVITAETTDGENSASVEFIVR